MEEQARKAFIGSQIAKFRRQTGLTQAQLAEKLGYSDKAVSKWERGDSVPDVLTLMEIARFFEVPVQSFLGQESDSAASRKPGASRDRILALVLAGIACLGVLTFVLLSAFRISGSWLSLLYSLPAAFLTAMILRLCWHDFRHLAFLISGLMWSVLLSISVSLLVFGGFHLFTVLLPGIPGQIVIYLCFRLNAPEKRKENSNG